MPWIPSIDIDIYSDAQILAPYETYAEMRALGPVVHMRPHDLHVLSRYEDVRRAAMDHRTFSSAGGVSVNPVINAMSATGPTSTTIASDPPLHSTLRSILGAPLLPQAVKALETQIQQAADDLIDRLVADGPFDAATDLARTLPLMIVSHLVGLPEQGRQNMLEWAAATFDVLGPMNERSQAAFPRFGEMIHYISEHAQPGMVAPDSWAARLYAAAEAGTISMDQATTMLIDYLGPSLDTTIFATTHLLHQLGSNPDQWRALKADPDLIPNAIEECVRLESPIRGFTRLTTANCTISGTDLAGGTRVLLLYASANRDDRRWHDPDRFDIARDTAGHLGFGAGRHSCAGMHLARLEIQSLLRALVTRVETIEIGLPAYAANNLLRGIERLPCTLLPA